MRSFQENNFVHVMNEDKQLIIVSQGRKKTPSGFGSVST